MHIEELEQSNAAGRVRDFTFLMYQVSLTFGVGSLGAVLIAYLLVRLERRQHRSEPSETVGANVRRGTDGVGPVGSGETATSRVLGYGTSARRPPWLVTRERYFWLAYFLVVFLVGVAVYGGTTDRFGVAHICLQALVVIGLAFLAASFRVMGTALRWLLIAGLALDFSVGILLHLSLENLDQSVVDARTRDPVAFTLAQGPMQNLGGKLAPREWFERNARDHRPEGDPLLQTTIPFWGDSFGGLLPAQQVAAIILFVCFVWLAMKPSAPRPALADSGAGRGPARAAPKRQRVKR
jgi:hypothetical protein